MGMWNNLTTAFTKQQAGGGTFDFFQQSFDISRVAPDMLDRVMEHKKELMSLDVFRRTSAAMRKLQNTDGTEVIRQLTDIGEFQHANSLLQPFLVAMPEYRKLYNAHLATGYETGFSQDDVFRGNAYMHTDDNYREMTSDISTEYDEDKIWHWVSNEDRQHRLTTIERVDLGINRARMREFDWEDGDPCSEMNASC
jgi:hypothetical protein